MLTGSVTIGVVVIGVEDPGEPDGSRPIGSVVLTAAKENPKSGSLEPVSALAAYTTVYVPAASVTSAVTVLPALTVIVNTPLPRLSRAVIRKALFTASLAVWVARTRWTT